MHQHGWYKISNTHSIEKSKRWNLSSGCYFCGRHCRHCTFVLAFCAFRTHARTHTHGSTAGALRIYALRSRWLTKKKGEEGREHRSIAILNCRLLWYWHFTSVFLFLDGPQFAVADYEFSFRKENMCTWRVRALCFCCPMLFECGSMNAAAMIAFGRVSQFYKCRNIEFVGIILGNIVCCTDREPIEWLHSRCHLATVAVPWTLLHDGIKQYIYIYLYRVHIIASAAGVIHYYGFISSSFP